MNNYLHGADRLEEFAALFRGKRLGLITNPSGMDSKLTPTKNVLHEHFNLCRIYGPEHGLYGVAQAGAKVDESTDAATGVEIRSMYGKTELNFNDLDCVIYDIQDVGLRFYTYIYVMARGMKLAAEAGIPFVVLDRYNPLGLDTLCGSVLKTEFSSGVGKFELPSRYALTCGELAQYLNEKESINCKLTLIPCGNLARRDDSRTLGLPFILPSPNIPTFDSLLCYVGTVVFEGTNISEGRGTCKPFETFGAPFIDEEKLVKYLKDINFDGVLLRPIRFKPTFSKHAGEVCRGAEIIITDYRKFDAFRFGLYALDYLRREYPEFEYIKWGERFSIDNLLGTDAFRSPDFAPDRFIEAEKAKIALFEKKTEQYRIY